MPIGGENVGTAYVRIVADGEGIDDQIRDMFDDAQFNEAGKANAKAYNEAFAEESKKGPSRAELRTSLAKTIAVSDVAKNLLNSADWKTFRNNLTKGFGDAGRVAADSLEREITEGLDLDAVGPRISDMRRDLANAQRQLNAERLKNMREFGEALRIEQKRQFDAEQKTREDADKAMDLRWADLARKARIEMDLEREIKKTVEETNRAVMESVRDMDRVVRSSERIHSTLARDNRQTIGELRREVGRLTKETDLWVKGEETALHTRRNTISQISHLRDLLSAFGGHDAGISNDLDLIEQRLATATPRLSAFNSNLDKLSEGLGRGFGKGSRNDFLNFFGSAVKGMTSLVFLAPKAVESLVSMGRGATVAFGQAGGGMSGLLAGLAQFAPLAAAAAAGAAALGIALGVLFVVIGPLLSLISLLVGAITALVSSLAFALSGALVGVLGLIAPLAFGLAAIAIGASETSGVLQQRLNRATNELSDSFDRLRSATQRGLFSDIENQASDLASTLDGLRPLFRRVGDAVSDVGTGFTEAMNGPGFRGFINTMETFIPNAIRRMGNILRNTLGGIGGMFESAVPFIEDFLGWLDKITTNFNEWANSAGGRRDVVEFLEDAKESAKSVGHFLEEAWLLLKDFMNEGKGTGDNLFDDMADAMERFREHLDKNPDALKNWFRDAEELATALGDAAVAMGKLSDELESSESRSGIIGTVKAVDELLTAFVNLGEGPLLSGVTTAGEQTNRFFLGILPTVERAGEAVNRFFRELGSDIKRGLGRIELPKLNFSGMFRNFGGRGFMTSVTTMFSGLGPRIMKAIGRINWGRAFNDLPGIASRFASRSAQMFQRVPGAIGGHLRRIPGIARSAFSSVPPIFNAIVNRLPPFMQNAVRQIGAAIARVPGLVRSALSSVPGIASNVVNRVTEFFANLPSRVSNAVSNIGTLVGNHFNRIVSAVQGIPDRIVGLFSGLGSRILSAIGSIVIRPTVDMPFIPGRAAGGILSSPSLVWAGEAGAEAIVPLNRPLAQVDPAVRALSAFAQGMNVPGGGGGGGVSRTIEANGWVIQSNSEDPHAVALETFNTLVARGY
jgi:hypothetical protein